MVTTIIALMMAWFGVMGKAAASDSGHGYAVFRPQDAQARESEGSLRHLRYLSIPWS